MSTLYVDRRDARIDIHGNQLRIHEAGQPARGFPLGQLERVVITGNVQLESRLLTQLAEQGASVLLLGGRGGSRPASLHGSTHGDAARRLGQYRICSGTTSRLRWARLIVRLRAKSIKHLLDQTLQQRPDCRMAITRAHGIIEGILPRLLQARDIPSLRGMEGAIGAAWFSAYHTLFAPTLRFTQRNRRPPRDPVNAALSLGYTLSHADAARACHRAGLDPLLGVYHDPTHGRESLACDLNELARANVEHTVWRLFADKRIRAEGFETHSSGVFMKKEARQHLYAAYEEQAQRHRRHLRIAAQAFARDCVQQSAFAPQDSTT